MSQNIAFCLKPFSSFIEVSQWIKVDGTQLKAGSGSRMPKYEFN